tara:strand:+ start:43 stop:186 length:144 start_codon:yes stop_codon:yes gene_type:complete
MVEKRIMRNKIIIANLKQELRWNKIMVSRLEKKVKELEDKLEKEEEK